jgi:hypothetical protein
MRMPGFSAERALHATGAQSRWARARAGNVRGQTVLSQARVGVGARAALGFSCDRRSCRCDGEDDCIDMFDTNVCGGTAFCYTGWVTGELVCICQR